MVNTGEYPLAASQKFEKEKYSGEAERCPKDLPKGMGQCSK